jgi:1-acyl-sn-glycerol-3-phosphate acyltransferase
LASIQPDNAAFMKGKKLGIWIMPEGTRSKDGRLLPFKKGFVHFAIAAGLPVVPVVFHGAHKNWPLGPLNFTPMELRIDVLPPIDTSRWKEETAADHAAQVRDVVVAALGEDQKPLAAPLAA